MNFNIVNGIMRVFKNSGGIIWQPPHDRSLCCLLSIRHSALPGRMVSSGLGYVVTQENRGHQNNPATSKNQFDRFQEITHG